MAKICKYGCGQELEWDNEQSAFKETQTGFYHNKDRCNKIKENKPIVNQVTDSVVYKQEERQLQQQGRQQQQQQIDRPSLDQVLLNQLSQSLNELKQSIEKEIKDLLHSCYELEKQNSLMLNALIEYFKLNQPTTANQLWNQQQNNPLQTQRANPNPTITDPLSINHGKIADLNELKDGDDDNQEDKALEEQGI